MLLSRGARIHTTNMGDDTPLHLAAAHGHREIVNLVRVGPFWEKMQCVLSVVQFGLFDS